MIDGIYVRSTLRSCAHWIQRYPNVRTHTDQYAHAQYPSQINHGNTLYIRTMNAHLHIIYICTVCIIYIRTYIHMYVCIHYKYCEDVHMYVCILYCVVG